MKYQKILGLVATAGLLLAGCATDSDNNNTWLSDPNAVHVSASVGSIFTRSNPTDEAKQTSFNKGDVMGVSNNGKSLNYTFNGSDWQPENGTDYLVWDNSNLTFQCWYPADGKNTSSKGYIQEDQSNETEIAKSDYMTAEVTDLTEIPGDRQLKVALARKTARLILNIETFNDQFTADTKVHHIRIASKASTDASETSIINIKPLQNGEGGLNTTYTALVIPGEVEGKLYFTDNESTETPLVVKTGTLEAGKSYTYNLTVGKNTITINDVTVAKWGEGKIEGGKAELAKTPYITFTAEGEQIFKMITKAKEFEHYDISGLEYSVNNNDVWKEVVENEEVTFGGNNGTLRLRGKNSAGTAKDSWNYATITFDKPDVKVACTGDIRTLLDYESYKTVKTDQARFRSLFENCEAMTTAPDLPAETLAEDCYSYMFDGCTSLKIAPKLPATTLSGSCYYSMFSGCTALETAPTLSAETLKTYCYGYMFQGCTSLKTAPELRATQLILGCYEGMFRGCSLESAPKLPATKLATKCYAYMFQDCKNLSSVTMLAPSDQIESTTNPYFYWLNGAGTSAKSRKLTVLDEAAYKALETNSDYLSAKWKKGAANTTVEYYTPKP